MAKQLLIGLLLGVALAGCGGPSAAEKAAAHRRVEERHKRAVATAGKAKAAADYAKCHGQLDPLLKALADLKGHLEVGLNVNEYSAKLGDARVAYDAAPFSHMSLSCLHAGSLAEKALNQHTSAVNYWNDCIESLNCPEPTKTRKLQGKWAAADAELEDADSDLEKIKTPPTTASPQPTSAVHTESENERLQHQGEREAAQLRREARRRGEAP